MFFEHRRDVPDRLFLSLAQHHVQADVDPFTKPQVFTGTLTGFLIRAKRAGFECRRTAADKPFHAVLMHEVEAARFRADHRLPTLDRLVYGARHNRHLSQFVAAVWDFRRKLVVLALMGKRLSVKSLKQNLDLFFEELTVRVLIEHRHAEGFDFATVIAAPNAENRPPLRHKIGLREILRQTQRMPHRCNVKAETNLNLLGDMTGMHRGHQAVQQHLIAFMLKVIFCHPHRMVTETIHRLRNPFEFAEHPA